MFPRDLARSLRTLLAVLLSWVFWARDKLLGGKFPPLPPLQDPIVAESATVLARRIREREVTAESVLEAYVRRARAVNPTINALVDARLEQAMEEARQVDCRLALLTDEERGRLGHTQPLLGVPFSCKETIMVEGMSHTGGLVTRRNVKGSCDAEVITRMREAGAIMLGVTNVPELSMWAETINRVYGRTNNPYRTSCTCGGSTGGEGALLSSCGTALSVGSDIGGSVRIPAFFCGVFGHKPTSGWVPLEGSNLFPDKFVGQDVLVVGPLARSARDLTLALQVMAPHNASDLRAKVDRADLSRLKVWWADGLDTAIMTPVDPEQRRALMDAVNFLEAKFGAHSEKWAWSPPMRSTYYIWTNKLQDQLRDQPPYTHSLANRQGSISLAREWLRWLSGRGRFTLVMLLMATKQWLGGNSGDPDSSPHYWRTTRDAILEKLRRDEGAVLLLPTLPHSRYHHYELIPNMLDVSHTAIFNVTATPVTAVPLGLSTDGMPLGIQVVGLPGQDHVCLAVAEALEDKFGGWVSPAPLKATPLSQTSRP